MARPVVLITGANAGIGFAATRHLAGAGATVVMACRNRSRGEAALEAVRREVPDATVALVEMDLSAQASIRSGCDAFRALGHGRLDVLIHNAAAFDVSQTRPVHTADGVESIWATNHLGPVLLTRLLEPDLAAAPAGRILTVASKGLLLHPRLAVRLDDPEFRTGGFRVDRAYYQSKLAQVAYTLWLAERHAGTSVSAACIRVGNVALDLDRYPGLTLWMKRLYSVKRRFAMSPEAMAEVYAWLALAPRLPVPSGAVVDERRRVVAPSRWARSADHREALMRCTERYLPA
jgi:NAD(P)-dependent dehydrogenase (short-subunit alcohol dehydrogenase family)